MDSNKTAVYSDDTIKTLEWKEHIRKRPGMYIGKLGDGSSSDDGIYVLIKEVLDNSVDEYMMGFGKKIEIKNELGIITVRDYGRGIPLTKVLDVSSKMNTGAKYDSKVFKKSVGLNGVGIKAVNALSETFIIRSFRDGEMKEIEYSEGKIIEDKKFQKSTEKNGTEIIFKPDNQLFNSYHYLDDFIEAMLKNYVYLNSGLTVKYNDKSYYSKNGLLDLLNDNIKEEQQRYPIIHLKGEDIEIALTHTNQYGEEYFTFVNGQHTSQGGMHLLAFREAIVKTVREFYKKNIDFSDIRTGTASAVSIKVEEPVFESQTKTKLGSKNIAPDGPSIRSFIMDFVTKELELFLHKNTDTADALWRKIQESEKERKEISGIKQLARKRAKNVKVHNKKLRDCRVHFNKNKENAEESTLFITEGDSASGSITKSRDVNTQAVFSLKGKPLNTYGKSKKIVYENEEFNLIQAALNIEDGMEGLRYNKIVIATDADVDGMHIRLLLITFFLKFFPDVIKNKHLFILQTPLFRVRNKKDTVYCYSDKEREAAMKKLGKNHEITRFKGLGEISPNEFKHFIGKSIRLDPVLINKEESITAMLDFYMGKNTPERQEFILENLRDEDEVL
ncbi:MAG: type IIA DNA topoisomerase subunit B [Bacteroidales bacterium]|nr:type IIA DNA topoisomerase subunit B [Bacteroidales bacterium]